MKVWKLGTIWGKGAPDFYEMIKKHGISIGHNADGHAKKGDIVIITMGYTVNAITVLQADVVPAIQMDELANDFKKFRIPHDQFVLVAPSTWYELSPGDRFKYNVQKGICEVQKIDTIQHVQALLKKYIQAMEISEHVAVLEYKKQVIFQGPPGTGKTRLAKLVAHRLIPLTLEFLLQKLKLGTQIPTVPGQSAFEVIEVNMDEQTIKLKRDLTTHHPIYFYDIIESYNNENWLKSTGNIIQQMANIISKFLYDTFLDDNEQVKLVQFHPSYSYEDFVRGIEAQSNGGQIEYRQVNKILGTFARNAQQNLLESAKSKDAFNKQASFSEQFELHKQLVSDTLASGKLYGIPNSTAEIIGITDTDYRYRFPKNPELVYTLPFKDFFVLHELGIDYKTSTDVSRIEKKLTRKSSATYYFHLYNQIKGLQVDVVTHEVPSLKKYILIIDEINRANLASVLGEMIYALEYRGEAVDSMYYVDNSNKFVLPSNLYVIGTMNTADRSVGQIDYAVRRRFAFIDVPATTLDELGLRFDTALFEKVSSLFDSHLSGEFEKKDVQLGHSYFIDKSKQGGSMDMRLKYEIKPILLEYVKDGILTGEDIEELIHSL